MAKHKTYAWNFNLVDGGDVLVRRAISQDSIGVLRLVDGQLEFWSNSICCARSKSIAIIFKAIDRAEKST